MVASTLRRGQLAIIGVDTEDSGAGAGQDSITFVLLAPIGSGTTIYFTDRAWNGTTFAGGGNGEGTFTYSAAADLPAGSVIRITQAQLTAAGIALSEGGEAIYAYQGTSANAPVTFLHAVDIADGPDNGATNADNFDFTELTNTGLVQGVSAVAIGTDNARFGTRLWNINNEELFRQINNRDDWNNSNNDPQPVTVEDEPDRTAPDAVIYVAGSGAGEGIIQLHLDGTYNNGTVAYAIQQAFQQSAGLFHPSDITIDAVGDRIFFVDADLNGNNRIVRVSISDILANPGAPINGTVLYSNAGTGATGSMRTLSVDIANERIYFDVGTTFNRINFTAANQTPTVLADLGPDNFITQASVNYLTGDVYLGSSSVTTFGDFDFVDNNKLFRATGLNGSNPANSVVFSAIDFGPNGDDVVGPEQFTLDGASWPVERGTIRGIDVNEANGLVYIVTGTVILDNDGSGNPTTYRGGVWTYNPANGAVTNLYTQNGTTGPVGLLYYIDVDPITGRYYVLDETGSNAAAGDSGVWTGRLEVVAAPTFVGNTGNASGLGGQGLEIQHAPTLTGGASPAAVTEATSAPNSAETTRVALFTGLTATDPDTPNTGDELRGAQVRISDNFLAGVTHQDILTLAGQESGTLGSGISYSYDRLTGTMTLSGMATVTEYKAALENVRFSTSGDNATDYGTKATRTVAASVFDGLLYSDEVFAGVSVTGINDAPVITPGIAAIILEDSTGRVGNGTTAPVNGIAGISVSDVDADPAVDDITVTFSVPQGTLSIRTDVTGGIQPADVISGNGTGTIVVAATQNQINATLAAQNASPAGPNGLIYTPVANFNGAVSLTITVDDLGNDGNDPGNSGTGTSEAAIATKVITVTDVNDAPVVANNAATSPAIAEDVPFTNANAPTVATLFGAQFSDPADAQQTGGNPTGTPGDTLAGIAITSGTSNANGQWQYWDGDSWEAIAAGTTSAARTISASTQIRFNPAPNYNGPAPALTVQLIESGGPAIVDNGTVNLSAISASGPAAIYTGGSVVLSQEVTAVNDAPLVANLQGDTGAFTEGQAAFVVSLDTGRNAIVTDVENSLAGGALNIRVGAGTGPEDFIYFNNGDPTFGLTVSGNTLSQGGVAFATFDGPSGNRTFTFNGNATPERVTQLVRSLTYYNSNQTDPVAGPRTVTFTLTDGSNGTTITTTTVNISGVNDAPSGADNSGAVLDDAVLTFAASDFSAGFSDTDGNAFAGVRITTLPATGTLSLSGTAIAAGADVTLAQLNAGALTYTPAAGSANSTPTFTFQVRDDGGVAGGGVDLDPNPDTFSIEITASNTAPTVDLNGVGGGTDNSIAYSEQAVATVAAPDLVLADDGGLLAGATVSVAANFAAGLDALTVNGLSSGAIGAISFSYAAQTGVLTLNGSALVADYQAVLRQVGFASTSDDPGVSRSLTWTVTDGQLFSVAATTTVTVTPVNDAPVVTTSAGATAASEQVAIIVDGILTVSDADGPIASATVQLTSSVAGEDKLTFTPDAALYGNIQIEGTASDTAIQLRSPDATATQAQWQAALRSITYTNLSDRPTTATDRMVSFVLTDGTDSQSASKTITVAAVDDAAVALNDIATTDEATSRQGNVLVNDFDPDGQPLRVAAVNGSTANLGQQIRLASGALLTLNADGTYTYDPNDAFNGLTAAGSGATNTQAGDSFTYSLQGGGTATVSVTINGLTSADDRPVFQGSAGADTITGTPNNDVFLVTQGGDDDLSGFGGLDTFVFGGTFTGGDRVDGGAGNDVLALQGDYSAGVTFGAGVRDIASVSLYSGGNNQFGLGSANLYDYNLTTVDGNVAAGQQLRINGANLQAGEDLTFNGAAETDGVFQVLGGLGVDTVTGGSGNDVVVFGPGGRFAAGDTVTGGAGYDVVYLKGNYTADLTAPGFAGAFAGVESIGLLSATNTEFVSAGGATEFDYSITWADALLGAGQTITVNGSRLTAEESMSFNGSAETSGIFRLFGGGGNDVLTGGTGNDLIFGGARGDTLTGGAGNDVFRYQSVEESNSTERDGIQDFNAGDLIDLSRIDAISGTAENDAFSFIGNAAFSGTAGQLRFENISLDGPIWMVQGDIDGDGVSDFEVVLVINPPDPITASDFLL